MNQWLGWFRWRPCVLIVRLLIRSGLICMEAFSQAPGWLHDQLIGAVGVTFLRPYWSHLQIPSIWQEYSLRQLYVQYMLLLLRLVPVISLGWELEQCYPEGHVNYGSPKEKPSPTGWSLLSWLGEPAAVIPAPSISSSSASTTAAALCSSRPTLCSISSPEVPPKVAPSSPVQSSIRRTNVWSTASQATRSRNAVAPKSSMFRGAWPGSSEDLVVSTIVISDISPSRWCRTPSSRGFCTPWSWGSCACSFAFGVHKAVSRQVVQSIPGSRAVNHGIPKTKSHARIVMIRTSGLFSGANWYKSGTEIVAFQQSLAYTISRLSRPTVAVSAGSSRIPSRLCCMGSMNMLFTLQSISASICSILLCVFYACTACTIYAVSGLFLSLMYRVDLSALGLSRITIDFNATRLGLTLSKAALNACAPGCCTPSLATCTISRRAKYWEW